MNETTFHLIVRLVELCIALLIGIIGFIFSKRDLKNDVTKVYSEFRKGQYEKIKQNPGKMSAYDLMEEQMLWQGIKYRLGANCSPFDYTVFRISIGFGFGLFLMLLHPMLSIVGVIIGFFGVPAYFKKADMKDNSKMLPDIGVIYGILGIQIKNNVPLTNVLYECFLSVKHPRLKKAMLELSQDIQTFSTVEGAVLCFRKKFKNEYIDTFARSLEQSVYTGNVLQLFEDTSENLNMINRTIAKWEEGRVEKRGDVLQMVLLLAIFLFVGYVYLTYGVGKQQINGIFH